TETCTCCTCAVSNRGSPSLQYQSRRISSAWTSSLRCLPEELRTKASRSSSRCSALQDRTCRWMPSTPWFFSHPRRYQLAANNNMLRHRTSISTSRNKRNQKLRPRTWEGGVADVPTAGLQEE